MTGVQTCALPICATWLAMKKNLHSADEIIAALQSEPLKFNPDPKKPILKCGSVDITDEIRSETITSEVSKFAAMPELRAVLVKLQREIIESAPKGIVVEGRDIGTTVAPNSQLKIFLTADLKARAKRRESELNTNQDLSESLSVRDEKDSTRATSPLEQALDAVVVEIGRAHV